MRKLEPGIFYNRTGAFSYLLQMSLGIEEGYLVWLLNYNMKTGKTFIAQEGISWVNKQLVNNKMIVADTSVIVDSDKMKEMIKKLLKKKKW